MLLLTDRQTGGRAAGRRGGQAIEDIRAFNKWVAHHAQPEQVVLPIFDGVSILRKKPALPFQPEHRTARPAPASHWTPKKRRVSLGTIVVHASMESMRPYQEQLRWPSEVTGVSR